MTIGKANMHLNCDQLSGCAKEYTFSLAGHSLGGVISAYIAENMAEEHNLPITDVVSWSAPLKGSDLLQFGVSSGIHHLLKPFNDITAGINRDFHPASPTLTTLRAQIQASPVRYFGVTGGCDLMVRPHSALPSCFEPEDCHCIPYLGHYNIKVSMQAWGKVLQHLRDIHL